MVEKGLRPGKKAPESGLYVILDEDGSNTGKVRRVTENTPLPPTPFPGQTFIPVIEASLFECPLCHTNQPAVDAELDTSLNEDQDDGIACVSEGCPAVFDLEWSEGYVYIIRAFIMPDFPCPECDSYSDFEIKLDGSGDITCSECEAEIELSWLVGLED